MFTKSEIIGAGLCVLGMIIILFMVQAYETQLSMRTGETASDTVSLGGSDATVNERTEALLKAVDSSGRLERMVIDDVKVGEGEAVKAGDTVVVHYIGRLPDGTEFDNSRSRGQTFQFTVGAGQVIAGWEEGIIGMQTGGQRILIVPPEKAYGPGGYGPIPPNATLVFSIELIAIQ